jgi:branched-subunit amino acid transport protein
MPSFNYLLLVILGTGLVTWLCRVLPFVILKKFNMPKLLQEFLSFVPVAIMAALVFDNMFTQHLGHLPEPNIPNILAALPSVLAAIITRSLLVIAIVGVATLALIRFLM